MPTTLADLLSNLAMGAGETLVTVISKDRQHRRIAPGVDKAGAQNSRLVGVWDHVLQAGGWFGVQCAGTSADPANWVGVELDCK